MSWNPEYFPNGTTPGVAAINTIFTTGRNTVNDLSRTAVRRHALNVNQTPSIIPSNAPVVAEWSADDYHEYAEAVLGAAITYNAFSTNNATDRTRIGDSTGGTNPTTECEVTCTWGVFGSVMDFIFASLNVCVVNVLDDASTVSVMVCLQYKTNADATWRTLGKTERFVDRNTHKISSNDANEYLWYDIPIKTLIMPETLTNHGLNPATAAVTGIRGMVSMLNPDAGAKLRLGSFNLSAVPMRGSLVVS